MVVTNNPKVENYCKGRERVAFVDGWYRDVLVRVRDLVHKGHLLQTHPLMGSLKPNETPYRSVIVSDEPSERTDSQSVLIIEDAISTFDKFSGSIRRDRGEWASEQIKEDFKEIDLSLIRSALD